ncbi:MAG: hypothetical protein NPIRA01_03490 [Nitrospirales bacterium]|nr:MAG: hypothetical protein NPIRA01_03490 [Nitrospirales bacterium]
MTYSSSLLVFLMCMIVQPVLAGKNFLVVGSEEEPRELTRNAGYALDSAWEAFHQAALGGTIASPELQTRMETDLQRGRDLLRAAGKALHHNNINEVRSLTDEIFRISKRVTQDSYKEKQ